MTDYLNQLVFGYYPYIAATFFIVGSIMRFRYTPYTWKSGSSQFLSTPGMRIGSNFFHIGIILLFFGHLVGLLIPRSLYTTLLSVNAKHILAMAAGALFGVVCFIGLTILIYRRLFNARIRATTGVSDLLILLLIYVELILGLSTVVISSQHFDPSEMVAAANWAQHIVTLRPNAALFIATVGPITKLHIFLGMTIFLIFPFTRLVHIWSAPVGYIFRLGYQIMRRAH